eukprot:m.274353 g.274353  ORF g.274353 m.274353 type:complete len:182 (+) comp54830_c1_seq5:687-1232(+)
MLEEHELRVAQRNIKPARRKPHGLDAEDTVEEVPESAPVSLLAAEQAAAKTMDEQAADLEPVGGMPLLETQPSMQCADIQSRFPQYSDSVVCQCRVQFQKIAISSSCANAVSASAPNCDFERATTQTLHALEFRLCPNSPRGGQSVSNRLVLSSLLISFQSEPVSLLTRPIIKQCLELALK